MQSNSDLKVKGFVNENLTFFSYQNKFDYHTQIATVRISRRKIIIICFYFFLCFFSKITLFQ